MGFMKRDNYLHFGKHGPLWISVAELEITSQVTNDVTKKIGEGVRLACNHVTFSVPQPKYSWFIINDEDPNDETRVTENARVLVGVTGKYSTGALH